MRIESRGCPTANHIACSVEKGATTDGLPFVNSSTWTTSLVDSIWVFSTSRSRTAGMCQVMGDPVAQKVTSPASTGQRWCTWGRFASTRGDIHVTGHWTMSSSNATYRGGPRRKRYDKLENE